MNTQPAELIDGLVTEGPAKGQIVRPGIAVIRTIAGVEYKRSEVTAGVWQWFLRPRDPFYKPTPEWDVELEQKRNRRSKANEEKETD